MSRSPKPSNDTARLEALRQLEILDTPAELAFDNLTRLTADVMGVPIALVSLVDRDRQWFKSAFGLATCETPRDISFCTHAVYEQAVLVVEDALQDERFQDNPLVTGEPNIRFYAGAPLYSPEGLILGTLCIIDRQPRQLKDVRVDQLKLLARQAEQLIYLHKAKNEAQQASQAKTEFLSSMSHELRTPMNAILGFAQLLQNGREPLSPKQRRQAEQISRSGRHLLSLINEVLDLTRIEAGHVQLSPEPVSLPEVISEAAELISPLADQQGIRLQMPQFDGTCPPVFGDFTRVKQVLINLLNNAIKYNRAEGSVELAFSMLGNTCRISIHDTGMGIPEEKIGELFEPFNRLDAEHSSIEGAGIGLALSYKLVRLMRGVIGVTSRLGEGSTFWFELPLCDMETPATLLVGNPEAAHAQTAQHQSVVLCIDDNPANQRLIREILNQAEELEGRIELQSVSTAEQGIELACSNEPDVILIDTDLPGMNGFDAQWLLSRNPLTAHIPVIAVTASPCRASEERAREAGFAAYMSKPVDATALVRQIHTILEQGSRK